ncbi:tyrosine-type recombinase/integrase [Erythrobacter sp. GH1-10]|uniref:tyrosine-type recombinase/integrase n=1 Tax=Erythrobacter sp. GH1-10 TaxID=3349334 RepID=UPI003877A2CC
MGLTALQIKNAKPGMHSDGAGLYLCVKEGGTKSWIFRFQLAGRRREMGLGSLDVLKTVEAREEAGRLKSLVSRGIDPIEQRNADKEAAASQQLTEAIERTRSEMTFRKAAEHYIENRKAGWSNPKHAQQWANTLKTYAYPVIGALPVAGVRAEHVIKILQPIWSTKSETASRVRMRIEAVLNAAKTMGWREGENPAVYKGGLDAVLPPISKVQKVQHHSAMPFSDAPRFMEQLREKTNMGAFALEFAILTAARSGEVRHATWDEIDLEAGLWTIPAERMKARKEHRVPLSEAAIALLESVPRLANSNLVFPGQRGKPLSDMTLSAVLKRMDLAEFTVHGFRSTFRDWAAETTDHSGEVVEMALAHTIGSRVEAAYRRGDLLDKRRALMADWADYLGGYDG